jgi:hypothetical protein
MEKNTPGSKFSVQIFLIKKKIHKFSYFRKNKNKNPWIQFAVQKISELKINKNLLFQEKIQRKIPGSNSQSNIS